MRTRYLKDKNGKFSIKAVVYEQQDHLIPAALIDIDARKICARLKSQGYEAYIVGGAVRDLLLGYTPKDFDIATSASPNRVKKLFRNSRIIGKRFRLVHVYFRNGKILEVATFRASESTNHNHVYGSLSEDVNRRDFSLNALYYSPDDETIIDFVGGVRDIKKGIIRSVLPLKSSFREDPVRMLRAVKYSAMRNMKMTLPLSRQIKKQSYLLSSASVSRLSEELNKILSSRSSAAILRMMSRYGLLEQMLPEISRVDKDLLGKVFRRLSVLDEKMLNAGVGKGEMLKSLTEVILEEQGILNPDNGIRPAFMEVEKAVKALLKPLTQPNKDVEAAVKLIFSERGWSLPRKRPPRHPEVRMSELERDNAVSVKKRKRRRKKSAEKTAALKISDTSNKTGENIEKNNMES